MNDTISYIREALGNHFQPEEIRSLVHLILKEVCGLEPHQVFLHKDRNLAEAEETKIKEITKRLCKGEPVQYILGSVSFYGYNFRVSPAVLIPRPETEELVDLIVREEKESGLHVVDIGTGSGCIAVSLAKSLNRPHVSAIDVSAEALLVAEENAKRNDAGVRFLHSDILTGDLTLAAKPDIIVSNPPYVMDKEKNEIKNNVMEYEPHLALFVPDNDPLLFYKAIARWGLGNLNEGGRVYFEINSALGRETSELMSGMGYRESILIKDISGRDRIIKATK